MLLLGQLSQNLENNLYNFGCNLQFLTMLHGMGRHFKRNRKMQLLVLHNKISEFSVKHEIIIYLFTGVYIAWKKHSKPRNLDSKTNKNNGSKPKNLFRKILEQKYLLLGQKSLLAISRICKIIESHVLPYRDMT